MNAADTLFRAGSDLITWLQDRSHRSSVEPTYLDFLAAWPSPDRERSLMAMLRSCVEPSKSLCAVATARNEGAYIVEWIAYHIELGVEAFFIYSNNNDDGSDLLLDSLSQAGVIFHIANDGRGYAPQYKAYGHALQILPNVLDFKWALIIDIDEYVVLGNDQNLQKLLDRIEYKDADIVSFNWHVFGIFGQNAADLEVPLTERFVLRFPNVNPHVKCAFKPRFCEHSHAHYPFSSGARSLRRVDANGVVFTSCEGEPALSTMPIEGCAWINHYWTKSLEEMQLKLSDNTGDQPLERRRSVSEIRLKLDELLTNEALHSPVEDRRIQLMLPGVKARMAAILALPGVREAYQSVLDVRRTRIDQFSATVMSA